jgi:hypothetical protein
MARMQAGLVLVAFCVIAVDCYRKIGPRHRHLSRRQSSPLRLAGSDDFSSMFGGSSTPSPRPASSSMQTAADQNSRLRDEAARLRQEAAELEVAMREEARAKGVPEEMINKLMPIRNPKGATIQPSAGTTAEGVVLEAPVLVPETSAEVRAKLGYLPTGDAVRFTQLLDKFKSKGVARNWNSVVIPASLVVTQPAFKSKTGLEPISLKLDSAGFDYKNVLGLAVIIATAFALASSQIGGQFGFLLGYASALFPVALVGVGSIAPGIIADVLNRITFTFNAEARKKHVCANAGKFLCGYLAGLPLTRFSAGGPSNTCDFFQLRPDIRNDYQEGSQKMFSKQEYKQQDIARASIVSIAGPVAECVLYKEASGTASGDVNTLYELMAAVSPQLTNDKQQDHIRWSACAAYEILTKNSATFEKLCDAFATGQGLEECISIIEATKSQ